MHAWTKVMTYIIFFICVDFKKQIKSEGIIWLDLYTSTLYYKSVDIWKESLNSDVSLQKLKMCELNY